MKVWVDGTVVDEPAPRISVLDHGLTTGDGVFETVKVTGGRPFALTRHLERLYRSAMGLGLPEPDLERVRSAVAELLEAESTLRSARLRVTYTCGPSPLGSARGDAEPTLVLALGELPAHGATCDVTVAPWTRNEHGALAGLKTTSYAENVRALAYATQRGADEAVFSNNAGDLCEGTGTNVFVVRDGQLLTPPLSAGCLAGVTRALILEWVGADEEDMPIGVLAEADEAFLTSTTRHVHPIRTVDERSLPAPQGPVTRKVQETFAQRSAEHPDP
ncbi:MAG: aminotransferase class IV [Streptosporangiaceae bacterium]